MRLEYYAVIFQRGNIMKTKYLIKLNERSKFIAVGGKAANLQKLHRNGYRVPATYVVLSNAFIDYLENDLDMIQQLIKEFEQNLDSEKMYAVRSSANMEDALEYSFAGQFKSVLYVKGFDNILQSVWSIWSSVESDAVKSYLEKNGKSINDLKMAVIIQDMVVPEVSGVAFSKNPTTGLDEIVIEAVHGDGSALVQEGKTPFRWINRWGKWVLKPSEADINLDLMEHIAQETNSIAGQFSKNVDLEWVYDGDKLYWVQMREITTLKNNPIYSNKLAREMLPGVIKTVDLVH